ncbi:MAG TPA: Holliday junction resolvase RuvX [Saprospiraceae bacterium]|nr:Holliday junction resolvase RuvX [Saprospiraceae bacterium]
MSLYLCPGMGRIMGIDYGLNRTGISVTDPLRIIVTGLDTLETRNLMNFIKEYSRKEPIDEFVVGYPFLDGEWGDSKFKISLDAFIEEVKKNFPARPVHLQDERFSSFQAKAILLQSGKKKHDRRDKRLIDKTSAIVILQEYLGHI